MEGQKTTVSKNKTAKVGEKYSYKYVDIAQIHEYLESIGARYYQYIDRIGDDDYIMTVRIVDGEEQKPLRGCRVVDATLTGVNNPAQQQGSALTYARRYSLLMAFGLATDDDDAQSLTTEKADTRKASEKQIAILRRLYQEENFQKLLAANHLERIEDMPMSKASELISRIMEQKEKEKNG